MSTYLVVKRLKEDRVYLPDELLVDPPAAAILMERGYIIVVPDNFVVPVAAAKQPKVAAKPGKPPKVVDLSSVDAESDPEAEAIVAEAKAKDGGPTEMQVGAG